MALVILPFASTVICGMDVDPPYVPAVAPLFSNAASAAVVVQTPDVTLSNDPLSPDVTVGRFPATTAIAST